MRQVYVNEYLVANGRAMNANRRLAEEQWGEPVINGGIRTSCRNGAQADHTHPIKIIDTGACREINNEA